jgi:hypothetical protein
VTVLLPSHFWDGTGGAILGGLLAFAAAMVIFFATRSHDLYRMRLESTLRSVRDLGPVVSQIEDEAERVATDPTQGTNSLLAVLDANEAELVGLGYELPIKHPVMPRFDVQELSHLVFWLGSDAPFRIRTEQAHGSAGMSELATEVRLHAAEAAGLMSEFRGLTRHTRRQRFRWWRQRKIRKWTGRRTKTVTRPPDQPVTVAPQAASLDSSPQDGA